MKQFRAQFDKFHPRPPSASWIARHPVYSTLKVHLYKSKQDPRTYKTNTIFYIPQSIFLEYHIYPKLLPNPLRALGCKKKRSTRQRIRTLTSRVNSSPPSPPRAYGRCSSMSSGDHTVKTFATDLQAVKLTFVPRGFFRTFPFSHAPAGDVYTSLITCVRALSLFLDYPPS